MKPSRAEGGAPPLPPLSAERPLLCLSLTGRTLEEDFDLLERYRGDCDLLELRLDFLRDPRIGPLRGFPRRAGLPAILTARRRRDGGHFTGSEGERLGLLRRLIPAGYRLVDLEEDLPSGDLEGAAAAAGVRIIRSFHDFGGVPDDLPGRLAALARRPGEIPKAAVTPRGSRDLLRLFRAGLAAPPAGSPAGLASAGARILLGMGPVGLPTRILAARMGSCLTYCSAPGREAAPGHLDPRTLAELYRFRRLTAATPVYGLIGNPVLHSRSPLLHNRGLAAAGLDGVYLPFQVDDLEAFFELAGLIDARGFSVTMPHKEKVIPFLAGAEEAVEAIGACNTLVRREGGWLGANTDAAGILEPLDRRLAGGRPGARPGGGPLAGLGATVIGAGGAARAAVYALSRAGARLLILNRTVDRGRRLAEEFGAKAGGLDRSDLAGYDDLIVQATSLGMEAGAADGARTTPPSRTDAADGTRVVGSEDAAAPADPLPGYRFSGREIVFDAIYTPPLTPFLRRARQAGCRVIPGMEMFVAQARAQFRLFTGRDLAPEAAEPLLAGEQGGSAGEQG